MRRAAAILLLSAAACSSAQKITAALTSPPAPPTRSASSSPSTAPSGERPAIVVTSPPPDADVLSPVAIRGTAKVSAGTVSIRLLDANGRELAAMNVPIGCGTGCRGRFAATLAFFSPTRQPGSLEVFDLDPNDGSVRDLVRVLLTLVPGS